MPTLTPADRYARARAAITEARAEIAAMPPTGRERTYHIARARKHLRAALTALRPLLRRAHATDAVAEGLKADVEALWPSGQT